MSNTNVKIPDKPGSPLNVNRITDMAIYVGSVKMILS
jgi:hypothetical protein